MTERTVKIVRTVKKVKLSYKQKNRVIKNIKNDNYIC